MDVPALAAAMASHRSLYSAVLDVIPLTHVAALDAVVSAFVSGRLQEVSLLDCGLTPQSLPSLTRLLTEGECYVLTLGCSQPDGKPLFVGDAVRPFCAALRASQLELLILAGVRLWESMEDAALLMDALAGHPTLHTVVVVNNRVAATPDAQRAAGEMLARLVSASLLCLDVRNCGLGDDGVEPLCTALAASALLRLLMCSGNGVSAACARQHVLPAVRANASLRELTLCDEADAAAIPELAQAEALVRAQRR